MADALPTCALTCLVKPHRRRSACPQTPSASARIPSSISCSSHASSPRAPSRRPSLRNTSPVCNAVFPLEVRADALVDVSTVFLVIAIICTLIRVTARLVGRNFGFDDLFIIFGLGVAIGVGGIAFPIRDLGLGKDIWNIPFDDITQILYLFSILTEIYPVAIACIKLSMLFLYLRLFPNPKLRIITWISIALVAAWGIIYIFVNVFVCTPRSYGWESWDGEHKGTCMDKNAIVASHAIENIIFDLSMPKKIGVSVMFLIGLVVTVLSILRLITTSGFLKSSNPTRDFVPVSIWSVIEIDLGIICACLPGMRAFFKFLFPSLETTANSRAYPWSSGTSGTGKTPKFSNLSISSTGKVRPSNKQHIPLHDMYSSRQGLVSPFGEETVADHKAVAEDQKMRTAMYNSE